MSQPNEDLIREAYAAYGRGDVDRMLTFVDPELEWTYLDPSMENPEPRTCHGRKELAWALRRQAGQGLVSRIQEITGHADHVLVVIHTSPGGRASEVGVASETGAPYRELTHMVVTVRQGRITAMRACRDRDEARSAAGLA